jgi:hypothetical protein
LGPSRSQVPHPASGYPLSTTLSQNYCNFNAHKIYLEIFGTKSVIVVIFIDVTVKELMIWNDNAIENTPAFNRAV